MALPVLPLHTDHPSFHCPFTGARIHDAEGVHLGPSVVFVHAEEDGRLWSDDADVQRLTRELAALGHPVDLPDWLAEHLRHPDAVAFRVDRGWEGVTTYALRPPENASAGSSTAP